MRKFLTLTILCAFGLCAAAQPNCTYDEATGLYFYIADDGRSEVGIGYGDRHYPGDLVIPARFTNGGREYTVTEIGYLAGLVFDTLMTSITIPETVRSLGDQLGNVSACPKLARMYVDKANPYFKDVDGRMILSKKGDTLYVVPPAVEGDLVLPVSVHSIKSNAIYDCNKITSLSLTGVQEIHEGAVTNCGALKKLHLGRSLRKIDDAAMYGITELEAYSVDAANPYYKSVQGVLFSKDGKTLLAYPCGRQGDYTIPASVRTIATSAFAFSHIRHLTLPATLTQMGEEAFLGCEELEDVTINCSSKALNQHIFNQCYSLKSVTLCDKVTEIPPAAFYNCKSLQSVKLPAGVKRIGESAFYYSGLQTINLPEGLKEIGERAFMSCSNLECVAVPKSVEVIGAMAFQQSSVKIDTLLLPNIRYIGEDVINSGSNLRVLYIGEKVDSIAKNAFAYNGVRYVYINAPVIGSCWFGEHIRLGTVVLGPNVRSIKERAFDGDPADFIAISSTPPQNSCSFTGRIDPHCVPAPSIRVPKGSGPAYTEAFKGSDLVPYEWEMKPEELAKPLPFLK